MEYIVIKDGIIAEHFCGNQKPVGAIEVPDGFGGYVGLPISHVKEDYSGLKTLRELVRDGIVEIPEGHKINDDGTAFIQMDMNELKEKYPSKTFASEGSFDAVTVDMTFDRFGNLGYWADDGLVEMSAAQPDPSYKAVKGKWKKDKAKAAELAIAALKEERAASVEAITVEVDGMVFDGDEEAQQRMSRTVAIATANGMAMDTETTWVLADNTVAQVTVQQLAQACLLAGQKQTELWTKPYETADA